MSKDIGLEVAQVRAEINHLCESRIFKRSIDMIEKITFAAHLKVDEYWWL